MKTLSSLATTVAALTSLNSLAEAGHPRADLTASSIRFGVIARSPHPNKARVRVTGVVVNVGNAAFRGNAGATLWQWTGGRWRRVAYRRFQFLGRLAATTVSADFEWFAPPFGAVEVPYFALTVAVGPDSAYDNPANNSKVQSGGVLNTLVQRSVRIHPSYSGGYNAGNRRYWRRGTGAIRYLPRHTHR